MKQIDMRTLVLSLILALVYETMHGQLNDTVQVTGVTITSYFSKCPLIRSPASIAIVDSAQLSKHHGQSLVPAINTIPGVRMEERSPGSYRLSIRGSLLRSPFGVRNVKVYIGEFPLTDAGGNTYINLIDPSAIQRIEVLKGPDGSLFGANSGGVVRFDVLGRHYPVTSAGFSVGSFGMFHGQLHSQFQIGKHNFTFTDAWHKSSGYRTNSELNREYVHLADEWNYADGFSLHGIVFFSELRYRTPGGLTAEQVNNDPRDARPPTAALPGAEEQKAGVYNRTVFGGVSHSATLGKIVQHHLAVFGSQTEFENPFITNYETRDEQSGGIRTWLQTINPMDSVFRWNAWVGFEGQRTRSDISNYTNAKGDIGTLQVADHLDAISYFFFSKITVDIRMKWIIEAALSLNYTAYEYAAVFPSPSLTTRRSFMPQWMPKISAAWQLVENVAWRASVAKGFSAPTLSEIRSSDNVINTTLQPEYGWNYETGIRIRDDNGIMCWDFSVFYYRLEHAIVRGLNEQGEEYFVNSGGTIQPGLESQLIIHIFHDEYNALINDVVLSTSYTFSNFHFESYMSDSSDCSGYNVTGVPDHILITSLDVKFPFGFSGFLQHNFTSSIPLNDANTVYTDPYNLVQVKVKWLHKFTQFTFEVFTGVDNYLDEQYSLGHDLNAFGKRYYNPAPGRNYYAGVYVIF